MSDSAPVREVIERLVKQAGITKKLAAEILHIIPEIIEEGLKRDGEARVKGLGTFRLKWVKGRIGRNPKTGERVEIPAHNRMVFLPERSFKVYINRDYRLLSYKIIPGIEQTLPENHIIPEAQPKSRPEPGTEPQPEPEPLQEYHIESEHLPEPEPQTHFQPDPEPPPAKRRIHWIIPTALAIIIILSLVFYVRNCCHDEVDSRELTVDSTGPVTTAQPEVTASDSIHQSAVTSQQPADSSQQPAVSGQQSAVISSEGKHLFKLARRVYGNPYLWVLIYKANQDKIADPDMLISGLELIIPSLNGKPDMLSRNDSLEVAEGYRLLYEYFKAKEDKRTDDFFKAMKRYRPK